MARLSPAFKRFEGRLKEVAHLRRMTARYNRLGLKSEVDRNAHANALIRAATVLLCSHVQGFVEDLAEQVIRRLVEDSVSASKLPDRLRYYATKRELEEITKEPDQGKIVSRLRKYAQHRQDILSLEGPVHTSFVDSSYKDGFGNPTTKEIQKFLRRFGFEDYPEAMKKRLGRNHYLAINAVDQIVDRRTKIAHGDSQASLTSREFHAYFTLVRAYCSATDAVTCSYFRKLGCKL